MPQWIKVDADKLSARHRVTEKRDGIEIQISISPYDIPERVRGLYDEKRETFVIEFSYFSEEKWTSHSNHKHVVLRIGEESGRVHGIEIDLRGLSGKLEARARAPKIIRDAIRDLDHHQNNMKLQKRNLRVTEDVVSDKQDELFSELAGIS